MRMDWGNRAGTRKMQGDMGQVDTQKKDQKPPQTVENKTV
jgi:hypothetical protein